MAPNSKGLPGECVDGLEPDSLNLVVEHVDQEVERQDGQGRIFDGQPRQGLFLWHSRSLWNLAGFFPRVLDVKHDVSRRQCYLGCV